MEVIVKVILIVTAKAKLIVKVIVIFSNSVSNRRSNGKNSNILIIMLRCTAVHTSRGIPAEELQKSGLLPRTELGFPSSQGVRPGLGIGRRHRHANYTIHSFKAHL